MMPFVVRIHSLFTLKRMQQLMLSLILIPTLVLAQAETGTDKWDIEQLMHNLAQVEVSHAFFIEKKSIAMLTAPIESSGELIYKAPNYLEKRTLKPKLESMILDNDVLIIELASQQRSPISNQNSPQSSHQKYNLQLQSYPEIAVFIESIRGTLAGDLATLQKNYQLNLKGDADHWVLSLIPIDPKMQDIVQIIDITGSLAVLQSIKISQTDGDSSLMLIEQQPAP